MADANTELLNTLDYLALNVPDAIATNIASLAATGVPGWRKKMAREVLVHYMGLYAFVCIVGGNGGIPAERRGQYEQLVRSLAPLFERLDKSGIDISPVVREEAARLGAVQE